MTPQPKRAKPLAAAVDSSMTLQEYKCPLGRPHESRTSPRNNLAAHAIQIHDDAEMLHRFALCGQVKLFEQGLVNLEQRLVVTRQSLKLPPKL